MTKKEELENLAYNEGISVDYIDFSGERLHGLYVDGSIALKTGMSETQTADILAEELGHHYTSFGNILDQNKEICSKQERAARLWAYNNRIGLMGIIGGYCQRCQNSHDLAEYLGVTEKFLQEAIACYHEKYGVCVELDEYIIFFEPALGVLEKFSIWGG